MICSQSFNQSFTFILFHREQGKKSNIHDTISEFYLNTSLATETLPCPQWRLTILSSPETFVFSTGCSTLPVHTSSRKQNKTKRRERSFMTKSQLQQRFWCLWIGERWTILPSLSLPAVVWIQSFVFIRLILCLLVPGAERLDIPSLSSWEHKILFLPADDFVSK